MSYEERVHINTQARLHRAEVERQERQARIAMLVTQALMFALGFILGVIV